MTVPGGRNPSYLVLGAHRTSFSSAARMRGVRGGTGFIAVVGIVSKRHKRTSVNPARRTLSKSKPTPNNFNSAGIERRSTMPL
jgi:hypothetical protein